MSADLKALRIVFVCPPDILTGGSRVISIYAKMLALRGHAVTVILPQHGAPGLRDRARALVRHGVWLRRPDKNRVSFFSDRSYRIVRLNHAGPVKNRDVPDADIVIATWWETVEWVWDLSESKGKKLHFMQDYETWGGSKSRVDATCALPIPKIVIAQWVQDLLEKSWGQTPAALVPNSVETERFFAPPRGKQRVPTFGFTYTAMPNKGCDVSIEAIGRARLKVPNLRTVAFGGTRPTKDMPLPPDTDFHFQAPDDQLKDLYAACDAWLFGTRREGFGLPILEAMACRTPVIGTPAGAAPTLIGRGGGILVPMEDIAAMADAMVRVATMTDSEWRTMSDAAYLTATSYSWDQATDRFEAALLMVSKML